jgi:hypothetical protein
MMSSDRNDPACRLKDIVKGYNFSAKIDARDPMTKRPIKKHAKPFMVENAVRFFEERRIQISAHDMALRNQLENYIIKHRTTAGVPVYGLIEERIGDHRLDAMMLALIGFKLEMSDFGQAYYSTHVAVSPGFAKLTQKGQPISPDKELEKRLGRMPQSRYDEDGQEWVSKPVMDLPAKTDSNRDIPVFRHGFMTDEEEKYKARYRLRNLRKRSRFHKAIPQRTNI